MTDYCPTQGGTFRAYAPEVLHEGEWTAIPIKTVGSNGVPYPALFGSVAQTIGLCGYSQAMCLAYGYAAVQEAEGHKCEVRVQAYYVEYDIKARKIDPTPTTQHE